MSCGAASGRRNIFPINLLWYLVHSGEVDFSQVLVLCSVGGVGGVHRFAMLVLFSVGGCERCCGHFASSSGSLGLGSHKCCNEIEISCFAIRCSPTFMICPSDERAKRVRSTGCGIQSRFC